MHIQIHTNYTEESNKNLNLKCNLHVVSGHIVNRSENEQKRFTTYTHEKEKRIEMKAFGEKIHKSMSKI